MDVVYGSSIANYMDMVYGSFLSYEDANRIQKIQNCCFRFICNVARREHITPHLRSLNWLKMKERRFLYT